MTQVKIIKVKDIVPDENQPRRYFNAEKMGLLKKSIGSHGVMTPIVVEEVSEGKFLLVDGERRFRASKELGLKEMPAIVEEPKSKIERYIRQFNIQEQHEAWTPMEKAMAILTLSDEMGIGLPKTCDLIGVAPADKLKYVAFATLADKSHYVKNEIPLDYANPMLSVTRLAHKIYTDVLEKPWRTQDDKALERRIIDMIKAGKIRSKTGSFSQLKDSFVTNPKNIQKFIEGDMSPEELFIESKARGAYHLRNALNSAGYLYTHGGLFLKIRDLKITPEMTKRFKAARATLDALIELGGE